MPNSINVINDGKPLIRFGRFRQGPSYGTRREKGMDYLIIYTLGGAGRIHADGQETILPQGSLVLFESGATQNYGTDPEAGTWELAWSHFHPRPGWLPLLRWPIWKAGIRRLEIPEGEVRRHIRTAATLMISAFRRPVPRATDFALNRLEELLLWADLVARDDISLAMDPRMLAAMDRLSVELDRPFSLGETARKSGLSVTRFCQLFKNASGESPQRFAEKARMTQAMFLLRESVLPVSEVAAQCGYGDALYFSRRFRKWFGSPPTAFRSLPAKPAGT